MVYEKNENYCSFSPEGCFDIKYNYGCYLHDRQYRNEVKIRKTREQADLDLRDYIYNKFLKAGKQRRGFLVSRIYYYAVRIMAYHFWIK